MTQADQVAWLHANLANELDGIGLVDVVPDGGDCYAVQGRDAALAEWAPKMVALASERGVPVSLKAAEEFVDIIIDEQVDASLGDEIGCRF